MELKEEEERDKQSEDGEEQGRMGKWNMREWGMKK